MKPLTSAPIPPSQRIEGLPPDLESLLLRCLAREPNERPHDAFAVHDAFADIVRRFGAAAALAPSRGSTSPPPDPREPSETVVDMKAAMPTGGAATANVGPITHEMSSRWSSALADLEAHIARARKQGGAHARAAARAAELSMGRSWRS